MSARSRRVALVTMILALAVGAWAPARADLVASISSSAEGITGFVHTQTAGWQFRVLAPLTLNALGIWDHRQDGLALAHDIAIFDDSGPLIVGATIAAGSGAPPVAGTRWVPVTPVTLHPGFVHDILATSMCRSPDEGGDRCDVADTVAYDPLILQTHLRQVEPTSRS